jgi:ribosomal-protein-alanine N-acetyltransferase
VRPSNEAALRLYRSAGFEEVLRRPGYYREPAEDALVMACADLPRAVRLESN